MKARIMLFGIKSQNVVYVTASDSLIAFAEFKEGDHPFPEGVEADEANIIDMLSNSDIKSFKIAPLIITCEDESIADAVIAQFEIQIDRPGSALERQEDMIERARLEAEMGKPADRRTLAEVHGLDVDDPWDNSSDESKEAGRKQNEEMKAKREAGGITGDSFGSVMGEKLNVHGVNVVVDKDHNVVSADVQATKNTLTVYELTIQNVTEYDFTPVFDETAMPENRILEIKGTTAVIKLHDHQIERLTEALDGRGVEYTLDRQDADAEDDDAAAPIEGHDDVLVFFSVQIENAELHQITPVIMAEGFDITTAAAMRNTEDGCWYAFPREKTAEEVAAIVLAAGHSCTVVAINRNGQSIIGAGSDARVVDTHVAEVQTPRPWNDRADEIDAMTDEEKAELLKGWKGAEFLFVIEASRVHKTIVYVTPESYFRKHDAMWDQPLNIDKMLPEHILEPVEGAMNVYKCRGLDMQLLKDNLSRWGFIESLRLRIHLNDLISEQAGA